MTQPDIAGWATPRQPSRPRIGRIIFWALTILAAASLVTSIAIPFTMIRRAYTDQLTSMENTIVPGDRVFVAGGSIRRGDVVVLHDPVAPGPDNLEFKRVIGLPGDHVACCDANFRVTVNGKELNEGYVYPGDDPSLTRFSVTLRSGQVWVMGDHRSISRDSRQWGPVPESDITGRVVFLAHGSSLVALRTPQTFVADGLAPRDTRPDVYARLALLAVASVAALLVLAIVGLTLFVIRRRRSRRAEPAPATV
jgi:signal peptidase I